MGAALASSLYGKLGRNWERVLQIYLVIRSELKTRMTAHIWSDFSQFTTLVNHFQGPVKLNVNSPADFTELRISCNKSSIFFRFLIISLLSHPTRQVGGDSVTCVCQWLNCSNVLMLGCIPDKLGPSAGWTTRSVSADNLRGTKRCSTDSWLGATS